MFTLSNSSTYTWNIFGDDDYDEDCFKTNGTDISGFNYSETMSSLIFHYWKKREEYINTDYAVTGWILCLIPREYVFVNENRENVNQFNVLHGDEPKSKPR